MPYTPLTVVGVVLALLLMSPSAPAPAPAPAPPPAPVVPTAATSTLQTGVTVFAMWRDWLYEDQLLAKVKESGSPWVRVDMGWCSLEEAGQGQISTWYQDRLDATVASAQAHGLKLLVDFGCTPSWAGGTGYNSWPTDASQVTRITLYLAQRYKGRVAAWEIWNEPDCIGGCPNGSPEQFVKVLRAGYQGIKAGDRKATVVSGGISGNNAEWISRMYAAGARGSFDALAVHPYQDPPTAAPDAACESRIYRFSCLPAIHDQMVRNGDGSKPIWLTEFGWTTAQSGDRLGVDEATQAVFLGQSIDLLRTYAPYVSNAFWYTLRDRDDWTPYENDFGLLHVDGSEKAAFAALEKANGVATGSASSNAAKSDAARAAAQAPEAQTPEAQAPETQAPESQTPEAQTPETQTPEAQSPEAQSPEARATESQTLEAAPSAAAKASAHRPRPGQEARPAIPTNK